MSLDRTLTALSSSYLTTMWTSWACISLSVSLSYHPPRPPLHIVSTISWLPHTLIHILPLLHHLQQPLVLPSLLQALLIRSTSTHVVAESFYLQQLARCRALDRELQLVLAGRNRGSYGGGNVLSDGV
jgi:hypothetical protein